MNSRSKKQIVGIFASLSTFFGINQILFANPICNDPQLITNYNRSDPSYHNYGQDGSVYKKLCSIGQSSNCNVETIFSTMINDANFIAPREYQILRRQGKPVQQCGTVVLQKDTEYLAILALLPRLKLRYRLRLLPLLSTPLVAGNPITTYIDKDNYSVFNITQKGHIFYPGYVRRTIAEQNGEVRIYTSGEGVSANRFIPEIIGYFNQNFGPSAFLFANDRLYDAVQKVLKSNTPSNVSNLVDLSIQLNQRKLDGSPWDVNNSPPDIRIEVYSDNGQLFYTPPLRCQDSFLCKIYNVSLPLGIAKIRVLDKDLLSDDLAGIAICSANDVQCPILGSNDGGSTQKIIGQIKIAPK